MKHKTDPPGKRPKAPPMPSGGYQPKSRSETPISPPPKNPNGLGCESEESKRFKAEMAKDMFIAMFKGITSLDDLETAIKTSCLSSESIYNHFFKKAK